MREICIFRYTKNQNYICEIKLPYSDNMFALEEFLTDDIGWNKHIIPHLEEIKSKADIEGIGFQSCDITKLPDGKVSLVFNPYEDLEIGNLIVPFDELIEVARKWLELVEKKVPYMLLEIEGEKLSLRSSTEEEFKKYQQLKKEYDRNTQKIKEYTPHTEKK